MGSKNTSLPRFVLPLPDGSKQEPTRVLEPPEPSSREDCQRLRQLKRAFVVAEVMLDEPCGLSVREINAAVCDRLGVRCHERTTYRDLLLLVDLGMAENVYIPFEGDLWRLTGKHEGLTRVLLLGLATHLREKETHVAPPKSGLLEGLLRRLPPPWHPSMNRHRLTAATAAASVLAALDTRDKTVREGHLLYCIGKGWQYHVFEGSPASAFVRAKPLSKWAMERAHDALLELKAETTAEQVDGWGEGMGPEWDGWDDADRYEPIDDGGRLRALNLELARLACVRESTTADLAIEAMGVAL